MLEVPTVAKQSGRDHRNDNHHGYDGRSASASGAYPENRFATVLGTLFVATIAIGTVLTATSALENRAAALPIGQTATPVPVQTERIDLIDSFTVPRDFVGQVEAAQNTRIAFELPGRVTHLQVDEAAIVRKGDVLARLDTRVLENRRATQMAVRDALEARVELSKLTMGRRQTLNQKGFMANQMLDQARLGLAELHALIAEAESAIEGIGIQIEKSTIRAPFDGEIGDRFVDAGATVSMGQPVMTILQRVAPQMRVGLSNEMADSLSIGDMVTAQIGAGRYRASLNQLRADIDPRTRTRTAIFDLHIDQGDASPLYGQSGTVRLTQSVRQSGAWVPVAALQEGTRGLWTVLTVQPGERPAHGVTSAEAVEILYADQKRAFVRGTFANKDLFVASGPHRITPGQIVKVDDGTR